MSLVVWLAVAVWMAAGLLSVGSAHPEARLTDVVGLLLPAHIVTRSPVC